MDVATIAMAALSPYLAKGAETFSQSVGKVAAEKVEDIYKSIKSKFSGDAYAEQTLARLKDKPNDEKRQSALKSILEEKMESDPYFSGELRQLVEEIEKTNWGKVIASGERSIAVQNMESGIIISGDNAMINRPP